MLHFSFQTSQNWAIAAWRKLASSRIFPYLLLLAVLLITITRDTRFFTSPRFWAEEGTRHFAFSFNHPWWQALFQPQVGYLNFWVNLSTVLATLSPLEFAPLVTTLMALLAQTIPAGLILWSRSPLWEGWVRKTLGVAVVLFVPLTQELWLNSVNDYPYFATAVFLILIEEPPANAARRWVYRAILLLGGLTGLHSTFLIPFFVLAALWEKTSERWRQTAVLIACAALHLYFIITYRDYASIGERMAFLGMATMGNILLTQIFGLFAVGMETAAALGQEIYQLALHDVGRFQMIGRASLVGFGLLTLLLSWNLQWKLRILFLGSFATLLVLPSMFTGITDKYWLVAVGLHQRLFLPPNILLGWMLLFSIRAVPCTGWRRWAQLINNGLSVLLLCAALFWGVLYFDDQVRNVETWPEWKQEVETWRQDPSYLLQIDPPGWTVELDPR